MRIVVDLPAPLLPKRRVMLRTSIARPAESLMSADQGLSSNRTRQARLGEADAGERASAIELRLQQRELRVEHFGLRNHAGPVPLGHDALRLGRRTDAVGCCRDSCATGVDVGRPLPDLHAEPRIELGETLPGRRCRMRCDGRFLRRASAVPQRPADADAEIPRLAPAVFAWEDAWIRTRVVHTPDYGDGGTSQRGD